MNKNEDQFGIIVDDNHQFNSLEEASNYTKDLKTKLKRKASMEEFPITTALPDDRLKFIEYGISLMNKKNLPFTDLKKIIRAKSVLWLVAKGYTFQAIAGYLQRNGSGNVTIDKIKEAEKEGMKLAMEAIQKVKNSKIPVVGGV